MESLAVGTALSSLSRGRLQGWLLATQTGNDRPRAGLPLNWPFVENTGTGDHGATNDVVVTWPPRRAPIVIAACYIGWTRPREALSSVLAEVGRIVASAFG